MWECKYQYRSHIATQLVLRKRTIKNHCSICINTLSYYVHFWVNYLIKLNLSVVLILWLISVYYFNMQTKIYSMFLAICVSWFLQAIPIVSKTRCLEKQGELQELCKRGSLFSIRKKCTPVYMFLFNDLLILTTKKRLEACDYWD